MMSQDNFYKKLDKIHVEREQKKPKKVKEYFQSNVFGMYNLQSFELYQWGTLLKDLRDKVAHRDRLRPSFESKETLVEKVLFNWPTLQK